MDAFCEALVSRERSPIIPEEYDFWGPLIGEWYIKWFGHAGKYQGKSYKGEWIFSRVLQGTAIQDIFIVPSREEYAKSPQPDAEYGSTIRFYSPENRNWNVFYGAANEATRLTAQREGDEIVLTELTRGTAKWIFSDIRPDSFHWRSIKTLDGGLTWQTTIDIYAIRKK
jgi:hypothetical protein